MSERKESCNGEGNSRETTKKREKKEEEEEM